MASIHTPQIVSFVAEASIAKGKAVKAGAVGQNYVSLGSANTARCIGIAQSDTTASGQYVEVAVAGGGAKALLGEAVAYGNDLVCHTDGTLVLPNASGDEIVARAMEAGSTGDLISVQVYFAKALAAQ